MEHCKLYCYWINKTYFTMQAPSPYVRAWNTQGRRIAPQSWRLITLLSILSLFDQQRSSTIKGGGVGVDPVFTILQHLMIFQHSNTCERNLWKELFNLNFIYVYFHNSLNFHWLLIAICLFAQFECLFFCICILCTAFALYHIHLFAMWFLYLFSHFFWPMLYVQQQQVQTLIITHSTGNLFFTEYLYSVNLCNPALYLWF